MIGGNTESLTDSEGNQLWGGISNTRLVDSPNTPYQSIAAANDTFDRANINDNLPFPSPHTSQPFLWGAEPQDTFGSPNYSSANFSPVGSVSLALSVNGAGITVGVFPIAQRIASIVFAQNSGLLSVDTTVAIANQTAGNVMGILVAQDVGAKISLAQSSNIYDMIIAPIGNYSKRSGVAFSEDIAPLIKSGTNVALYAFCADANAASLISVGAVIRYISLDG